MIIRKLYHLQRIRNNPWKPKEFLERLQQRKLGLMIKHAYLNVPYYRAMFRQKGLYPEDIKSAKDLRKLPVTTKADLQERWPLFLSAGVQEKDCRVRYTSGSTGNPHKLFFDRNADDYGHATDLRSMYENGYTLRSRMIAYRAASAKIGVSS
jgi:phenylacetate-CoA ligase